MSWKYIYPSPKMLHTEPLSEITGENAILKYASYHSCQKEPEKNEDSIFVMVDESSAVLGVFDGMGGHEKGAEASKIITDCLKEELSGTRSHEQIHAKILKAIDLAHLEIKKNCQDSGSTLVLAHIHKNKYRIYSIGDSLGIHFDSNGSELFKMIEQSPLGFAKESGIIKEEQIESSGVDHIVHFAMGLDPFILQISSELDIKSGESLFLCSDGFYFFPELIFDKIFSTKNSEKNIDWMLEKMKRE